MRRDLEDSDLFQSVRAAISENSSAKSVAFVAERLESVTDRAQSGDPGAREECLAIVYALEEGRLSRDPRTLVVRRFLLRRIFDVQERYIERTVLDAPLSREAFHERIRGGLDRLAQDVYLTAGASDRNPMLEYLFEGNPSFEEVRVWIRHAWFVAKSFYRLIADFAPLLDIEQAGSTYANLVEESGYSPAGSTCHFTLLKRMVQHFGVSLDDEPTTPEAHEYLTNRFRCVRHPDREWGLGVLWAFEAVTSEKHAQSLRMLKRLGVPDEVGEFYRVHIEADQGHSQAFLDVVDRYVVSLEQQRNFLTALALHTRLRRAYFAQIWTEIQSIKLEAAE